MPALEALYANKLKFYGQLLTRAEVIARKRKALAAAPGFKQQLLGQASFKDQGDSIRVLFQKRSGPPGARGDVRSTLVLVEAPQLAIREEADLVTERRFSTVAADTSPDTCDSAVWMLVDSTPFASPACTE